MQVFRVLVGGHGQGVAALVLGVSCMALEPVEGDTVPAVHGVEPEPQVHVLLLGEPGALPGVEPAFVDGLHHVGGVAPDMDFGILPLDGFEALDDGEEFHAVVRGEAVSAGHLLPAAGADENDPVSARAGVAAGGPVGVQEYGRTFLIHGNTKIALSSQ